MDKRFFYQRTYLLIVLGILGLFNILASEGTEYYDTRDLNGDYSHQGSTDFFFMRYGPFSYLQNAVNYMNQCGIDPELNDAGPYGGGDCPPHGYYHEQNRAIDFHIHTGWEDRMNAAWACFEAGFTRVYTGDASVAAHYTSQGKSCIYKADYAVYQFHADNRALE